MRDRLRWWLRTAGSAAVVLAVILLVSSDAGTAIALTTFCVVGYLLSRVLPRTEAFRTVRSRMPPGTARAIGAVLVVVVIASAADSVDAGLWMTTMAVTGYTGYRSGSVFRGAVTGGAVGAACAVLLVGTAVGLFVLVTVLDVAGSRAALYRVLFAPQAVGFFGLLWVAFVVVLGGGTGLISGGLGGAVARLR